MLEINPDAGDSEVRDAVKPWWAEIDDSGTLLTADDCVLVSTNQLLIDNDIKAVIPAEDAAAFETANPSR